MSKSLQKLQSLGETVLTAAQKNKIRKLAKGTTREAATAVVELRDCKLVSPAVTYDVGPMTAEQIASVLDIPSDLVEEVLTADEQRSKVDPRLAWAKDRQRMELSEPTKELFVRLFADHDRERIILEATNLVRKHVAEHVAQSGQRWKFDDLESVCTIAVIEETDRLLAKGIVHTNPGSVLIDKIKGTIFDPPRDQLSTQHRLFSPRDAAGKQHTPMHRRVERSWPRGPKSRDDDKMFTGERDDMEFGAPSPVVDERWELLGEICDDDELLLLDLLAQGYTHAEAATELQINVSTITTKLRTIKTKVSRHEED